MPCRVAKKPSGRAGQHVLRLLETGRVLFLIQPGHSWAKAIRGGRGVRTPVAWFESRGVPLSGRSSRLGQTVSALLRRGFLNAPPAHGAPVVTLARPKRLQDQPPGVV